MKLGILETGITPTELLDEHGSYAQMFMQLFDKAGYDYQYEVFEVKAGQFPSSPTECDGWIITGSKSNVYEQLPWMATLKEFILAIHQSERPMVGICFGHQIVAEAFGGVVEQYAAGWGVGLHTYRLEGKTDFIKDVPNAFTINAVHQDQVVTKPDNAEVFATSEFCPLAGLVYDDRIFTLQSHPEFNVAYEEALLTLRDGDGIPNAAAQAGLASLREAGAKADSLEVARWMAEFLEARVK
ncbi:glutamine amidotransferase-related protein [Neptunomonas marina]|uniref:Glutamine amidotransferase n=1 Tax=Neptunomonas marina TaxID=1815562 RepID=A0A437Q524_9GAMM|nr:glutamine amidotransferase [Neptunomonas marina]RVU29602.1 glutamine amidotransferase [Neptunomonas marina]